MAAILVLVLPSCYTVGPDYVPPEPDVPDVWHATVADGLVKGQTSLHRWWTLLNDPVLNDLVKKAGSGNLSLKAAFARIQEAEAQRGVASGELYPAVAGRADLQRGRTSENGQFAGLSADRTSKLYTTGLDASWEIDLWGRIRRAIESADAEVEASVENYRDLLVSLLAETAATYVQVRALQARIEAAESNARNQRGTLKLTEDRFKAGLAPALDVSQARLNLATSESTIPTLKIALHNAVNRLAVLIGEYPGAVNERLAEPAPVPEPPAQVAVGLPRDLLRQRPDLRQAERQLAAQTARIGVAAAELYPSLSLSGTFGLESVSSRRAVPERQRHLDPGSGAALESVQRRPHTGRYPRGRRPHPPGADRVRKHRDPGRGGRGERHDRVQAGAGQARGPGPGGEGRRGVGQAGEGPVQDGHDRLPERAGLRTLALQPAGPAGREPRAGHAGPDQPLSRPGRRLGSGSHARGFRAGRAGPAETVRLRPTRTTRKTRSRRVNMNTIRPALAACCVVLGLTAILPGCALVQFDRYDSFDGWFSATRDPFEPESIGVGGLEKGGTPDYVVNDLIIRSPVFLGYDLARFPLILVAVPRYALFPTGKKKEIRSDHSTPADKPDSAPAPAPASHPAPPAEPAPAPAAGSN